MRRFASWYRAWIDIDLQTPAQAVHVGSLAMNKAPVAGPRTEGRTFGNDWSIANVARLLRSNAGRGAWDSASVTAGSLADVNQYYFRKASAKHLPTSVSVILMRLAKEDCWYASLCFADDDRYLSWNANTAEQWLCAMFGQERSMVRIEDERNPSVRQFTLAGSRPL
jgi:hypothetical protein